LYETQEAASMSSRSEEFREFARERALPLHQSAYLLCGDWHSAHDLVQETLLKAYRHWPRVKRADNPDAYVRGILLNEVRDRWRRPEKAVPVAHFTAEPAVPDAADDIARRDRLLQALLELPLQQRITVVLRYLEDMTQVETAKLLGCSEGTVKSQSSRALTTLRNFLIRTESKL
jgi:RNA polymerase sigma-70 factor (sigma-E family)